MASAAAAPAPNPIAPPSTGKTWGFHATAPAPSPAFSALLTHYAHIPPAQHATHLLTIRDRAYATHPYPCLGRWRFLSLDLSTHPQYPTVLSLIRDHGATFLDLGCCLGQDVRKVAYDLLASPDGTVTDKDDAAKEVLGHLYAADLQPAFIDAGYALFRDEGVLPPAQFLRGADVFDTSEGNVLGALDGGVGVLHVTAVFHLFDWEQQQEVAGKVLRLLRRGDGEKGQGQAEGQGAKRALVLGSQVGADQGRRVDRSSGLGLVFRHDEESWRRLWEGVMGSNEWKDVVRGVEVHSELRVLQGGDVKSRWGDDMRWHVWWVFVDFF